MDVDALTAALAKIEMTVVLGPRPGKKSRKNLEAMDLTHVCTLLSEREDVRPVEKICQGLGAAWIWLPIEGGSLDNLRATDLPQHFETLVQNLSIGQNPRVYVHCSAGIHRTGFFTYLLLRLRGMNAADARTELSRLRAVTADQIGEERLELAEELIARRFGE